MPGALTVLLVSWLLGRAPVGWWVLNLFRGRRRCSDIDAQTGFRQAVSIFGCEGAACWLLGAMLRGMAVVWWAEAWGLSPAITRMAVGLLVLGACRTHRGKLQDPAPLFTTMGALSILMPAVNQLLLALWLSTLAVKRRTRTAGLVAAASLPWACWYYRLPWWDIAWGTFLGAALVEAIIESRWTRVAGVSPTGESLHMM